MEKVQSSNIGANCWCKVLEFVGYENIEVKYVNRRSIKAAKLNKRFALGKIEINPTEEEAKEFGFGKEDKKEEERPAWTHINLLRNKYFNKK